MFLLTLILLDLRRCLSPLNLEVVSELKNLHPSLKSTTVQVFLVSIDDVTQEREVREYLLVPSSACGYWCHTFFTVVSTPVFFQEEPSSISYVRVTSIVLFKFLPQCEDDSECFTILNYLILRLTQFILFVKFLVLWVRFYMFQITVPTHECNTTHLVSQKPH